MLPGACATALGGGVAVIASGDTGAPSVTVGFDGDADVGGEKGADGAATGG